MFVFIYKYTFIQIISSIMTIISSLLSSYYRVVEGEIESETKERLEAIANFRQVSRLLQLSSKCNQILLMLLIDLLISKNDLLILLLIKEWYLYINRRRSVFRQNRVLWAKISWLWWQRSLRYRNRSRVRTSPLHPWESS